MEGDRDRPVRLIQGPSAASPAAASWFQGPCWSPSPGTVRWFQGPDVGLPGTVRWFQGREAGFSGTARWVQGPPEASPCVWDCPWMELKRLKNNKGKQLINHFKRQCHEILELGLFSSPCPIMSFRCPRTF